MHLFYTPDISTTLELPQEEAAHALRVLRLSEGDEVMLTDGKGSFYRAEIDIISGKRCYVRIVDTTTPDPLWQGHLHLALAPTKNMDRIEWFVEKATEIGVSDEAVAQAYPAHTESDDTLQQVHLPALCRAEVHRPLL